MTAMAANASKREKVARRTARCPICGRAMAARFAPFCSQHCADVDLARWLRGTYAIPGDDRAEPPPDEDDDAD